MHRDTMIARLEAHGDAPWDLAIIGGGATGLGVAIDSAARGYKTVLLERHDFAQGTSSRSSKLIHGCVQYLQRGQITLAMRAMKERALLRRNAPHLVRPLPFVIPNYDWWEPVFYGIGMRYYNALSGRGSFGPSRNLSRKETIARIPTIDPNRLRGGVVFHDGQFDDARLAIHMAATASEQGAVLLNYMNVSRLLMENGKVAGVAAVDSETGAEHTLRSRVVINATGPFCDAVRRMEQPQSPETLTPSQGVHLVLPKEFLPGDSAIAIPRAVNGRAFFAIPWHGSVIAGTTDTPVQGVVEEPRARVEEIETILANAARHLTKAPAPADVRSVFAGIRPLTCGGRDKRTADLSRDHSLTVSGGGLVTIAGGKWTTYRHMAEDTVDRAAEIAGLEKRPATTEHLQIHGYHQNAGEFGPLAIYGSDAPAIQALILEDGTWGGPIHPELTATGAEVVWAVREEMARNVEDVLARRTRSLLLHARASKDAAPAVAKIMAQILGRDAEWEAAQFAAYSALADGYVLA